MQTAIVNHTLLGSPVTALLVLHHFVRHHIFPVSLSLLSEGPPSVDPAAALGTADDRASTGSADPELQLPTAPCGHLCSQRSCLTAEAAMMSLLLGPEPAPVGWDPCCRSHGLCWGSSTWQCPWLCQDHTEPHISQQSEAGCSGMPSAMGRLLS